MGTKINSPHYTVKLDLPPGKHTFTLVVSQYEKSTTIRYTIEAFSTAALSLQPIPTAYPPSMENKIVSSWTAETAGGCPNDRTSFESNPKYSFTVCNQSIIVVIPLTHRRQHSQPRRRQCS